MNASLMVRLAAVASIALFACGEKVPEPTNDTPMRTVEPETPEPPDMIKEDLVVGTGPEAKTGDKVKVNYTGRLLKTNFMFDTSVGKKPFDVNIGAGGVIKGWDEGIPGMKVGGKRKLTIPSRLAYGDKGHPLSHPRQSDARLRDRAPQHRRRQGRRRRRRGQQRQEEVAKAERGRALRERPNTRPWGNPPC